MNASLPFRMDLPRFVHKKRQLSKTTIACDRCKMQKLRCDEQVPCTRCLKRGRHEECTRRGEFVTCVVPTWGSSALPSMSKSAIRLNSKAPDGNVLVKGKSMCKECGKGVTCFHKLLCGSCLLSAEQCKLCEEELEKAAMEHLLDVGEIKTPVKPSDVPLTLTSDAPQLKERADTELLGGEEGIHEVDLLATDPQDLLVSGFLTDYDLGSFTGVDRLQFFNEDWLLQEFSSG
mmetsp:Transcript_8432/g.28298  ORF Transcript_8432/g.28298 Transcript_8432/m.28298 type:complete len:232 (+) Transcript_8432:135-830(+)